MIHGTGAGLPSLLAFVAVVTAAATFLVTRWFYRASGAEESIVAWCCPKCRSWTYEDGHCAACRAAPPWGCDRPCCSAATTTRHDDGRRSGITFGIYRREP